MLHAIREEMSRDADYDMDLFAEMVRSGKRPAHGVERNIRGFKSRAPRAADHKDSTNVSDAATPPRIKRRRRANG